MIPSCCGNATNEPYYDGVCASSFGVPWTDIGGDFLPNTLSSPPYFDYRQDNHGMGGPRGLLLEGVGDEQDDDEDEDFDAPAALVAEEDDIDPEEFRNDRGVRIPSMCMISYQ